MGHSGTGSQRGGDHCGFRDFRFGSGETLPELRQHYLTLGTLGAPAVLLVT